MNEVDLYSGYEGEPEFVVELRRDGIPVRSLRAWSAHLDRALGVLEPGVDGWEGLLRHFHLLTGWLDAAEWVDPDPEGSAWLLGQARPLVEDDETRRFIDEYVAILRDAIDHGGSVVLREE